MTFLTRMKCPLALGLCILVGLSTFSSPAFAASGYTLSDQIYLAPYTNVFSDPQPIPGGSYQFDYSATQTFHPVNITDISYKSLSSVGGTVTASGDLTFSSDSMVSTGDTVYLVCTPKTSSSSQLVTPSLRPLVIGSQGSWNQTVQDYNVLGIITDPADLNGVIDLSFDLPPDGDYQPIYLDGADSVVNMVDNYPGPWFAFSSSQRGFFVTFTESSILYNPSLYQRPFDDQPGLSFKAGEVFRLSFPVISDNNKISPLQYHNVLSSVPSSDLSYTASVGDLYARNIGTADNPILQYVYWITFDFTAYSDGVIELLYLYFPSDQRISGFGNFPNIEIIDSDAVVVSKLQQLLDYYSQNPPEADDLKAQSDMQKALEDAAIQDARNSLASSSSAADPDNVLVPATGLTILGAITAWSTVITDFVSAVPWLAVLLAIFVFTTLVSFLIRR